MRLINSKTLELHEFAEGQAPQYIALSHTWCSEEVSYQEMLNPTDEVKRKLGYQKIMACARACVAWEWDWIWVDTCCTIQSHHWWQYPTKKAVSATENDGSRHPALNTKLS